MPSLSRRDFLRLGGLGFLGLASPSTIFGFSSTSTHVAWNARDAYLAQDELQGQQGRVTTRLIWVYDKPSFTGRQLKLYWRDSIVDITGIVISQDAGDYNRIWYEIDDQGYAYSGNIQPVQTLLNQPVLQIPEAGILGAVTVPYTDAHEQPQNDVHVGYRMYYDSIHWIQAALTSSFDGRVWYQVLDDKWNYRYYAPAEHLRTLTPEELSPLSPDVPDSQKRIQVRLDDQLVLAYEFDKPVFATRAATGAPFISGTYTEAGLSLHGTYWHNDFGHPKSHGCVNLSVEAAKWLFRWTNPVVNPDQAYAYVPRGTAVEIVK